MQNIAGSAIDRTLGMIRFDTITLRNLVRDPRGTSQAALVVGLVSVAVAIGVVDDGWVRIPLLGLLVGGMLAIANRMDTTLIRRHASRAGGLMLAGVGIVLGALTIALHLAPILVPLVAWLTFTGVAWFACNQLVGRPETVVPFSPLLRAVGFSFAPGMLAMFTVIPVLGGVVMAIAIAWTVLLLVFSISQTARLGTERAIIATAIASLATVAVSGLLLAILSV